MKARGQEQPAEMRTGGEPDQHGRRLVLVLSVPWFSEECEAVDAAQTLLERAAFRQHLIIAKWWRDGDVTE